MHALITELFPICRSLTGPGVRQSLALLAKRMPLQVREVPTGTRILDWTAPREWTIRDAWIRNAAGEKVVDFQQSNLHVIGYSVPVQATLTLDELRPRLRTIPEAPDWIPYRTSYLKEDWGFCLSQRQLDALGPGPFDVRIDSSLEAGSLSYGECLLPGDSAEEMLFSAHICHPSVANDGLSGIAVATALAALLDGARHRLSYRFLFVPATLGSIAWLAAHRDAAQHVKHGLVLACCGDRGPPTYKRSRRGDASVDRAVARVFRAAGLEQRIEPFSPWGYDERQYCSPGFNLPVGCLMRTPYMRYPEYHTSADNLDFVTAEALAGTLRHVLDVVGILEENRSYRNLSPYGEPQLGSRGLFQQAFGRSGGELALLWVLNYSDGDHALLDIAELSGMPFDIISEAAERLVQAGLLEPVA